MNIIAPAITYQKVATKPERYLALDVLRGMTIALMILVNTPGSWSTIYAPFRHASWHGFTPTDLVFPAFLFVVGNAMSFSLKKFEIIGEGAFLRKVLKRTTLIFIIGLFLNAFPFVYRSGGELMFKDLSEMRIMGVLQRIALCYFFASLIIYYLKLKKAFILSILFLFGYWAIMWFFGDHPNPYSLNGNAAQKFDALIFPKDNIHQGYGLAFDPEGLLSTLPAIVSVIAGYLVGVFIQKSGNNLGIVWKLSLVGIGLLAVGQLWDLYFPINKPIWTSSFVLFSTGWTLLLLSFLILIIEIAEWKRWTYFFDAFGKNPLFIYVMSGLVISLLSIIHIDGQVLKLLIYDNLYLTWLDDYNASLIFAISYMLLMWLLGYWLHKRKIYIKV